MKYSCVLLFLSLSLLGGRAFADPEKEPNRFFWLWKRSSPMERKLVKFLTRAKGEEGAAVYFMVYDPADPRRGEILPPIPVNIYEAVYQWEPISAEEEKSFREEEVPEAKVRPREERAEEDLLWPAKSADGLSPFTRQLAEKVHERAKALADGVKELPIVPLNDYYRGRQEELEKRLASLLGAPTAAGMAGSVESLHSRFHRLRTRIDGHGEKVGELVARYRTNVLRPWNKVMGRIAEVKASEVAPLDDETRVNLHRISREVADLSSLRFSVERSAGSLAQSSGRLIDGFWVELEGLEERHRKAVLAAKRLEAVRERCVGILERAKTRLPPRTAVRELGPYRDEPDRIVIDIVDGEPVVDRRRDMYARPDVLDALFDLMGIVFADPGPAEVRVSVRGPDIRGEKGKLLASVAAITKKEFLEVKAEARMAADRDRMAFLGFSYPPEQALADAKGATAPAGKTPGGAKEEAAPPAKEDREGEKEMVPQGLRARLEGIFAPGVVRRLVVKGADPKRGEAEIEVVDPDPRGQSANRFVPRAEIIDRSAVALALLFGEQGVESTRLTFIGRLVDDDGQEKDLPFPSRQISAAAFEQLDFRNVPDLRKALVELGIHYPEASEKPKSGWPMSPVVLAAVLVALLAAAALVLRRLRPVVSSGRSPRTN